VEKEFDKGTHPEEILKLSKLPGSSTVHFLHVKRDRLIASPLICSCSECKEKKYENCEYGTPYIVITDSSGSMKPLLKDQNMTVDKFQDQAYAEEEDCNDDMEIQNEARKDLVAEGCIVAVKASRRSTTNYWLFEVAKTHEDHFEGIYLERERDTLKFKKTRIVEYKRLFFMLQLCIYLTET
jgi:hypothetical protein